MNLKQLFVLSSLLAASSTANAEAPNSNSCASGYVVFFGNGVNNNITQMNRAKDRVRLMLGQTYNGEPVRYALAVNPSNGIVMDLLEVFSQKMAEDPTLTWSIFLDFIRGTTVTHSIINFLSDYFIGIQLDPTIQLKQSLAQFTQYSDPTVNSHVLAYTSQLIQGKKIMVVAHSQGNLYANAAYYKLSATPNIQIGAFGIAAVANPANEVAGGTPYVTSRNDMVINALRALQPATLPHNDETVPINAADILGHGFNEIYTNNIFPSIASHTSVVMNSTLGTLRNNASNTSGPVTATLAWDTPGDVDLHIYEPPNNNHVFYASRAGLVGYLDRDDTTGTGPEHYYTSCQNITPGIYKFGVNYYSGSGSRTATIRLDVLGQILPGRSIVLPQAFGSSGNNSSSILFNLNIIKNQDGSFSYMVQ